MSNVTTTVRHIRLDDTDWAHLDTLAALEDRSVASLVRRILREHVRQRQLTDSNETTETPTP